MTPPLTLWRHLLHLDGQLNLTDPDAMRWAASRLRSDVPIVSPDSPGWDAWCERVQAVRSLAERVHRHPKRADRPPLSALAADAILNNHLDKLRVRVVNSGTKEGKEVKDADGFVMKMPDTVPPLEHYNIGGMRFEPDRECGPEEAFWVRVFLSMVDERTRFVPLCPACSRPLPPTPTGKASRAALCDNCKAKKSLAKKPTDEVRKAAAERKRKSRAAARGRTDGTEAR